MSFSVPAQVKALIAAVPVVNRRSPFTVDQPISLFSHAGSTVYGVKHPGTSDTTKYARFVQSISGNKAFKLPSGVTAPTQVTGGATGTSVQLHIVALVDGVISKRSRDDQVAASGAFVVGSGGGTAVADATLSIKGTTAADLLAGSILLSVASSGADTQTINVGDILTIGTDPTVYRCTETSQALNGTTQVEVSITPPLQQACTAGDVVTVVTSDDRTVIFDTAPAVGAIVEVFVMTIATDIITVAGGALSADRIYEGVCYDFMVATALTNMKTTCRH